MSQLGKSNLNLNLNLNLSSAAGLAADGGMGCRINTEEFRKLVDSAAPFAPNGATAFGEVDPRRGKRIKYREFWDAELQAYVYLNEFLEKNVGWLGMIRKKLDPIEEDLRKTMNDQLVEILDHVPERESRFAEILQQHNAEGCISYWLGMLLIDFSTPATYLLVRVARRIGEHVGMCLKQEFRFPRPSQLCPAIVPMVDPPLHPSFPSGHALQSHLISRCMKDVRGALPQANRLLDGLAERVAVNRVIAGLHYPKDNKAGVEAAELCYEMLKKGTKFLELLESAKKELYAGGEARNSTRAAKRGTLRGRQGAGKVTI
jgi:acid phosphatase (class A)